MNCKILMYISTTILLLGAMTIFLNTLFGFLSDGLVRGIGIAMIIALPVEVFCVVKLRQAKRKG